MVENFNACGLVRASPTDLTIKRLKHGRGFKYVENDALITCQNQKKYLKALAIPPVYTNVLMTTNKRFHLQATGVDTNGNQQYFYNPKWENFRDEQKFKRLIPVAKALPRIRRNVSQGLKQPVDSKAYILASIVKLLDYTGLRIGNWQSAAQHKTYGLITLHKKHVEDDGLAFNGKAGVEIKRPFFDHNVQTLLEEFYNNTKGLDNPLFAFQDHPISASMVNDYLDDISGIHMTAKEFRTWRSNVLFLKHWQYAVKNNKDLTLKYVTEQVAEHTCNTPSILKSSYLHPALLTTFKKTPENPPEKLQPLRGLRKTEQQLLYFLK